jgi:GR25 family glycosyltransferase involved in LPS biosynthesis
MNTLVINLAHRTDKLDCFLQHWSWLVTERSEGILHSVPHTGCGLAHIAAIRKGLQYHEWCLILEDDAILNCEKEYFIGKINQVTQNLYWDAVFLGACSHLDFAEPSSVKKIDDTFFMCESTKSIRCCVAMLWSRNALPMLEKYESLLLEGHIFPIDRLLLSGEYPWENVEKWNTSPMSICMNHKSKVLICKEQLVTQQLKVRSDNTNEENEDLRDNYLQQLYQRATWD